MIVSGEAAVAALAAAVLAVEAAAPSVASPSVANLITSTASITSAFGGFITVLGVGKKAKYIQSTLYK